MSGPEISREPPRRAPVDVDVRPTALGGVPCESIDPPDASRGVLLHVHGGGYLIESVQLHRNVVGRLARASRRSALIPRYRAAPEHRFPAALDDVATAYRGLLAEGVSPARVLVAGDSAGGGLAVGLVVALRSAGDPLPAGLVCLSPWVDLACATPSLLAEPPDPDPDPLVTRDVLLAAARQYLGDHPPEDPRASPLRADLHGLPPLLVQYGGLEKLRDDARALAARARACGVEVQDDEVAGAAHAFQLHAGEVRRADEALARIVAFSERVATLPSAA